MPYVRLTRAPCFASPPRPRLNRHRNHLRSLPLALGHQDGFTLGAFRRGRGAGVTCRAAYERAARVTKSDDDDEDDDEDEPASPYEGNSFDEDDRVEQIRDLNRSIRRAERVWRAKGYGVVELTREEAEAAHDENDTIKVDVGPVGKVKSRQFKVTPRFDGKLVTVVMERPLGAVFAEDDDANVRCVELVDDSQASRAAAVAKLNGKSDFIAVGDVLRAMTATVVSVPRTAGAQLLGNLDGTTRVVILYGADNQPVDKTLQALRQGKVADGPMTLILERPDESNNTWTERYEKEAKEEALRPVDPMASKKNDVPDAVNLGFLVFALSFLLLFSQGF
ncbi:hypothetical protein PPROV_000741400 [Pycnococcus provasolii]|uniref:Uncharacterized protein n=1 Tax=Pycnococcus provasolii TaxID=41880 RepID=A0A830HUR4_9CHLO|nr:hypothetical protein PPROV_000741400 [Pycnococcus provasolii]